MRIRHYIWPILIVLGCRQNTDIVLPKEDPILVVNSVLSSDSFITVRLSYTQGITENTPIVFETGASVIIYNQDTQFVENLANTGNGWYKGAIKAVPSSRYLAKIAINSTIYWAFDSVPLLPDINVTDTSRIFFQGKPGFFSIEVALSDKQTSANYYGMKMRYFYEYYVLDPNGFPIDTIDKNEWIDIETVDPILTESDFSKFSKKHLLWSDKYFNNTTAILRVGSSVIIRNNRQKPHYLVIYTEHYTTGSFQYYTTLNEHIFYQNDPFSQPTIVNGNIPNAFGSFVGKSVKVDTIHFQQ